jgi:hypothetical protein
MPANLEVARRRSEGIAGEAVQLMRSAGRSQLEPIWRSVPGTRAGLKQLQPRLRSPLQGLAMFFLIKMTQSHRRMVIVCYQIRLSRRRAVLARRF